GAASSGGMAGAAGLGGGAGSGGMAGAAGSGGSVSCLPMPACDAPLPNVGPKRSWIHSVASPIIVASGFANHRGRDMMLTEQDDQWVIGKFAYGVIDKDLKDEEVDLWLLRDCGSTWEKLATVKTTPVDGSHPTVEGVDDSGGRVYYQIPASQKLGLGRHRIHMVVAGDLSSTDVYIEVMPKGTHYFATDVDGTLTTKETEEYSALLTGTVSDANPGAAQALTALAEKGYRPFYLTARPEFLVGRTREFVSVKGFPLGIVHTTLALGALGANATTFKKGELNVAQNRGFVIDYAFGNTDSDAEAFFLSNVEPGNNRIMYQFSDTKYGCRRIDAYSELLPEFQALSPVCN
ncbi:MAG: phosphatidylinositol transfer protein, partial [Myxococcales bacterium]|nr:phosphatidylinositol transfer protein [Myxococcales bacterium]